MLLVLAVLPMDVILGGANVLSVLADVVSFLSITYSANIPYRVEVNGYASGSSWMLLLCFVEVSSQASSPPVNFSANSLYIALFLPRFCLWPHVRVPLTFPFFRSSLSAGCSTQLHHRVWWLFPQRSASYGCLSWVCFQCLCYFWDSTEDGWTGKGGDRALWSFWPQFYWCL